MIPKRRVVFATTLKMAVSMCVLSSAVLTVTASGRSHGAGTLNNTSQSGNQYLVEFNGSRLPHNLPERIAALGGTMVEVFPEIKVALVGNLTEAAAAALASQPDVADVTSDEPVLATDAFRNRRVGTTQPVSSPSSVANPENASWYPYQWNMRVIGADRAWQAGYLGSRDVKIAVIDTGIDPTHPALAGLIDAARSTSFCPAEDALIEQEFPGYPSWTDLYGHGTYVASIAAGEGDKLAGVSSRTTIMAVKWGGIVPCPGSSIYQSIYYSANNGADVINLSAGTTFAPPKAGQKGLLHYATLFIRYALQKGVSAVVVSAGNSALDLDHNRNGFMWYCDVPGVICTSATGPTDSGPDLLGPFADVDSPAFYTNFGSSAIDVAAPGGNLSFDASGNIAGLGLVWGACAGTDREIDADGNLVPGLCSSGGYDLVGSAGTSAAAPHVSGLAALLVGKLGRGRPAQVRASIENSADDRGRVGIDPFYGRGRINVARALGVP
jgi:lantibiotic leader peptide-processing serine protease